MEKYVKLNGLSTKLYSRQIHLTAEVAKECNTEVAEKKQLCLSVLCENLRVLCG